MFMTAKCSVETRRRSERRINFAGLRALRSVDEETISERNKCEALIRARGTKVLGMMLDTVG